MLLANVFKLNFYDTCTHKKYSYESIQILNNLKQRGSKCLDKCWNIKKVSPSTREPSSSGREHLTHSGRNWQELGWAQNQPFLLLASFAFSRFGSQTSFPGSSGLKVSIMKMCVCLFVAPVRAFMCVFVTIKYDDFVFLRTSTNSRFKRPPTDVDRRKESSRFHKVWIWRPWRDDLTKVSHNRV